MPTATRNALTDPLAWNAPGGGGQAYNNITDRTKIELPEFGDPAASGCVLDFVDAAPFVCKSASFTTSQKNVALWVPGAGNLFCITDLMVNAATAGFVTIYDTTNSDQNRVVKLSMATNGIFDHSYSKPFLSSSGNAVLKYDTAGASCSGYITVTGYEVVA